MTNEQTFIAQLRRTGERVTTPRVAIFRLLERHAPIALPQLIAYATGDGIDTVTVYRTLALFRRLGFLQELGLGSNRRLELSDAYEAHHHHFTCRRCGRVVDFDSEAIERDLRQTGETLGFTIESHQIEASGLCAACSSIERT